VRIEAFVVEAFLKKYAVTYVVMIGNLVVHRLTVQNKCLGTQIISVLSSGDNIIIYGLLISVDY